MEECSGHKFGEYSGDIVLDVSTDVCVTVTEFLSVVDHLLSL